MVVALLSITWLLTYAHLLILSSAFTIMNLTVSFSYPCSVVLYSILFYFTYLCNFLCLRHDLIFIFSMFYTFYRIISRHKWFGIFKKIPPPLVIIFFYNIDNVIIKHLLFLRRVAKIVKTTRSSIKVCLCFKHAKCSC